MICASHYAITADDQFTLKYPLILESTAFAFTVAGATIGGDDVAVPGINGAKSIGVRIAASIFREKGA